MVLPCSLQLAGQCQLCGTALVCCRLTHCLAVLLLLDDALLQQMGRGSDSVLAVPHSASLPPWCFMPQSSPVDQPNAHDRLCSSQQTGAVVKCQCTVAT